MSQSHQDRVGGFVIRALTFCEFCGNLLSLVEYYRSTLLERGSFGHWNDPSEWSKSTSMVLKCAYLQADYEMVQMMVLGANTTPLEHTVKTWKYYTITAAWRGKALLALQHVFNVVFHNRSVCVCVWESLWNEGWSVFDKKALTVFYSPASAKRLLRDMMWRNRDTYSIPTGATRQKEYLIGACPIEVAGLFTPFLLDISKHSGHNLFPVTWHKAHFIFSFP